MIDVLDDHLLGPERLTAAHVRLLLDDRERAAPLQRRRAAVRVTGEKDEDVARGGGFEPPWDYLPLD